MHFPSDWPTILKLAGSVLAGSGSLVLAWRAKHILEWVVNCIVMHDVAIKELLGRANGQRQAMPVVVGSAFGLLDAQDKIGWVLLILGFAMLGFGMLCNALSFVV